MDRPDRKRASSKAFQPTSSDFGDAFRHAARSVAASSAPSTPSSYYTPLTFIGCAKENETPLFEGIDKTLASPMAHQAAHSQHQRLAPLAILMRTDPSSRSPLQELSKEQYTGNGTLNQMLPLRAEQSASGFSGAIPPMVVAAAAAQQPSLPGSAPPDLDPDLDWSSLLSEVLGVHLDSEPGPTNYEETDTSMCYQNIPAGPISPSELNIQDLSLLDIPYHPLPAFGSRPLAHYDRTSIYIVESSIFDICFPVIRPSEVIIGFDKGLKVIKVDKYPLCSQSRFFAKMLDGPHLSEHTRCVRLRNDFPYAIVAMMQFIETGDYMLDINMLLQHPHFTLLDLHIHAYQVGVKYEVPNLCEHAIAEYINVAQMVLNVGVPANTNRFNVPYQYNAAAANMPITPHGAFPGPTFPPPPRDPNDIAPAAVMDGFLDSLVLLWKNTPNRHDPLREAVLELIKRELNKLLRMDFFVTLMMELVPFGDDIMHSLEEDGFHVEAFRVPVGMQRRWVLRFGQL